MHDVENENFCFIVSSSKAEKCDDIFPGTQYG